MANLIRVCSTIKPKADGGNTVALYETHEDHPNGEAYVAGPAPVTVARTAAVHRLISDGTLEEVADEPVRPAAPRRIPSAASKTATGGQNDVITETQRDALVAAGFETPDDIRNATDDELLAVEGIGPVTVERLREATKE